MPVKFYYLIEKFNQKDENIILFKNKFYKCKQIYYIFLHKSFISDINAYKPETELIFFNNLNMFG